MGETATQQSLPDASTSWDHLFQNVHSKVFFNKIAAAGFPIQNEQHAQELLGIAGKLRLAKEAEAEKQAQATSPYAQASAALDGAMAHHGLDGGVKTAEAQQADLSFSQAAAEVMQDPTIYNATLAVKAAEADQLAEQFGIKKAKDDCEKCGMASDKCSCK